MIRVKEGMFLFCYLKGEVEDNQRIDVEGDDIGPEHIHKTQKLNPEALLGFKKKHRLLIRARLLSIIL